MSILSKLNPFNWFKKKEPVVGIPAARMPVAPVPRRTGMSPNMRAPYGTRRKLTPSAPVRAAGSDINTSSSDPFDFTLYNSRGQLESVPVTWPGTPPAYTGSGGTFDGGGSSGDWDSGSSSSGSSDSSSSSSDSSSSDSGSISSGD